MMFIRRAAALSLALIATCWLLPPCEASSADNLLSTAVTAWKSGDAAGASRALDQLLESGTTDPRAVYLRGILTEQSGGDGSEQLRAAAELEAASGRSRLVNQLLEAVQGPLRGRIESLRQEARNSLKPDPVAARHAVLYSKGLAALKSGNLSAAIAAFDQAIAENTADARIHYMRGVALVRSGDRDGGIAAFQEGLSRETTGDQIRMVNAALRNVQGDVRQLIEENTVVAHGSGQFSRQDNRQLVMQQEELFQQQLAEADEQRRGEMLAQTEQARLDRARRAAESIIAAEQSDAEKRALLGAAEESNPFQTQPQPEVPAETQASAPANPFGGNVASPFGGNAATAEAESSTPVNPFLSSATAAPSAGSAAIDFSWLSPQSELLVYIRPSELLGSPFVQPLTAGGNAPGEALGISPTDIDSVTMGIGNVMAVAMQAGMQAQAAGGAVDGAALFQQLLNGGNGIAVARTKSDIDVAQLAAATQAEAVEYNGVTYYRVPGPPDSPPMAVHGVDARTFVAGSEDSLKAALDRGPGNGNNPVFGFVSGTNHLAIAFASPMMSIMSGSMPDDPNAPQFVQDLTSAIRGKIAGSGLTIMAGRDLQVTSVMSLTDSASATAAGRALQGAAAQGKQAFPQVRPMVPEKLQSIADQIVSSLTASSSGNQATITATIPASLVTTLQENPEILGQLMMGAGGLGGPPGGPPGAPGFGPPGGADPSQGFGFPPAGSPSPGLPAENPAQGNNPSEGFGFPPAGGQPGSPGQNPAGGNNPGQN